MERMNRGPLLNLRKPSAPEPNLLNMSKVEYPAREAELSGLFNASESGAAAAHSGLMGSSMMGEYNNGTNTFAQNIAAAAQQQKEGQVKKPSGANGSGGVNGNILGGRRRKTRRVKRRRSHTRKH